VTSLARRTSSQPQRVPFSWLGLSQVWVRFLLAIVGLTLAFAAALFFHGYRARRKRLGNCHSGRRPALLLATFVGLTTVPYLARRVVASRVREAMDYDVTRAGMIYILSASSSESPPSTPATTCFT